MYSESLQKESGNRVAKEASVGKSFYLCRMGKAVNREESVL